MEIYEYLGEYSRFQDGDEEKLRGIFDQTQTLFQICMFT